MSTLSLKIKNEIREWNRSLVMGVLDVTPDSFFAGSRIVTEKMLFESIDKIIEENADIIDIGGMSTRPGADIIDIEEEWRRVAPALKYISENYPKMAVSVDTFRAEIARRAHEEFGADIINDISGGGLDNKMIETVGKLNIVYLGMHMRGTPATMQQLTQYDNLMFDLSRYFGELIKKCKDAGIADIILDPGIGFSKTLDQNYHIINNLEILQSLGYPILIGVSRKSFLYRFFEDKPENMLNATTVMNTISLLKGVNIIRVHDVKEAVEAVKLVQKTLNA